MRKKIPSNSGIKTEDGSDVMTELSGIEFKRWLLTYAEHPAMTLFINIKSYVILDGEGIDGSYDEKRKYKERKELISFVERLRNIPKNEKKWQKFLRRIN